MPNLVIIGGGIAGLASAIAFQNADWDVQVLERAPRIEPMGAALSIWSNACAALEQLDVLEPVANAGAAIKEMRLAEKDGRQLFRNVIEGHAYLITRAALQNALVEKLASGVLRLGCSVDRIEGQTITLADGTALKPDLIVDAGGIRSPTNGVTTPRYAGYGGVLALTSPVDGPRLEGVAGEYWGKDERFGVFELPDNRRYWFYMRTQRSEAVMPSLETCIERAADWPDDIRLAVQSTKPDALIPFAVHSNAPPRALGDANAIRVGDAAHAMEPNQGQGACQGLEDAAALAVLAGCCEPTDICKAYEALRLKRARMFVTESARVRVGVHGPALAQRLLRMGLRSAPEWLSKRSVAKMQTMPDYAALAQESQLTTSR